LVANVTLALVKALVAGIAAVVVLLVAPSTGMAQAALPVGEAHGVRIVREQGAIVVVFTERAARLYKRIAGRLVEVDCTDQEPRQPGPPRAHAFLAPDQPGKLTEEAGGGVTMRAPNRRRKLVTGDLTRGMDFCRVWLAPRAVRRDGARRRIGRRLIVSVPLTQAGAVFLDEELRARRLLALLAVAGFVADEVKISGWPSYAQLVDTVGPGARPRLVSLASPTDTPPPRTIGYYSDRQEHVAVATLSRSGRRLFIEGAGDVLSTNVAAHIFGDR
jgi:hypothetical protein